MLAPFRTRFDRVFEDTLALGPTVPQHAKNTMQMALDLPESETDFNIKVDMPGFERENIALNVTKDNRLVIIAERKTDKIDNDGKTHYHRVERSYGAISRRVQLPQTADVEKTKAKMENGVLKITIGKREPPKTKSRITIQ